MIDLALIAGMIAILRRKWGTAIIHNGKRKDNPNEVIMYANRVLPAINGQFSMEES